MDSYAIRTAFNPGGYPVLDRRGRPFTPGCRLSFRVATFHVNSVTGTGTLKSIDEHGGLTILSDNVMDMRDRNGAVVRRDREFYAVVTDYRHGGEHKGCRVASRPLGDPHEHGTTELYAEVEGPAACDVPPT